MSERLHHENPALSIVRDVLNGISPEDYRHQVAAYNFLETVHILYGERGFVLEALESGSMTIVTPEVELKNIIAEGVVVDRRMIALLNANIWTDPSFFDPKLVRFEGISRVYPATRRTIDILFRNL